VKIYGENLGKVKMKIKCLATGSKGNCYILENRKGQKLIVEAGIKIDKIWLGIENIERVIGAIISHNHGDHNYKAGKKKTNKDLLEQSGIEVICTDNAKTGKTYKMGDYEIIPLEALHNITCYCYLIKCDGEITLFATDTNILPRIKGMKVDTFILEVNHSINIMNEIINDSRGKEENFFKSDTYLHMIAVSGNHMSLERVVQYIKGLDYKPKKLFTIHASNSGFFNEGYAISELSKYVDKIEVMKDGGNYEC
jgi:hypothetical protein